MPLPRREDYSECRGINRDRTVRTAQLSDRLLSLASVFRKSKWTLDAETYQSKCHAVDDQDSSETTHYGDMLTDPVYRHNYVASKLTKHTINWQVYEDVLALQKYFRFSSLTISSFGTFRY